MRSVGLWACLLISMLLSTMPLRAADSDVFAVQRAGFQLEETMLVLDASIQIALPDYMAIAIDQGFAVPIRFQVQVMEDKNYWFDRKVVSLQQRYLLHYLPMLDSYVVSDVNQGQRIYFDSRDDAVDSMRRITRYPMFDIGNIDPELKVYARMRFGLDSDELPLPLKSSSLWDNDWDIDSKWFYWAIVRSRP